MGTKKETINMVEVMVGARKVFVPRISEPEIIRERGNIPDDRMLVVQNDSDRRICKPGQPMEVLEGDIFSTMPVYEPGNQNTRFQTEVDALRMAYPDVSYDKDNHFWVYIKGFDLPPGLNKKSSDLLIEVPRNYPFGPPKNFFLDRTIKTRRGRSIEHYYPNQQYNKYLDKGWAWFSLHIKTWKVKAEIAESDSLLTAVDLAYLTLQDIANNRA